MELPEDLLPSARIRCRLLLPVKGIQGRVAVEAIVSPNWRVLVAREQSGIVGVIAKTVRLCWLLRISVLKQGNRQSCKHFITAYLLDRWRGKGTGRAIFDAVFWNGYPM